MLFKQASYTEDLSGWTATEPTQQVLVAHPF